MEKMPLFLINGFLEAGKTQFIRYTIQQDYFQTEGKTLLLVCEEGEEEYDADLLAKTHTIKIQVDSFDELTPEYFSHLEQVYDPERVLMEFNGMWDIQKLALPDNWELYQQITIIDGSTFDLYLQNMKALIGIMVRNSELVIMNRCDGLVDKLSGYQRILKGMNQVVNVVFEDAEGELQPEVTDEDLPYDVKADVIEIQPKDFGIWYIDMMETPARYKGKTVEFTAMVLKRREFPKNNFVAGRIAMTCCEADQSFLGYMVKAKNGRLLETRQWVKVRARVEYEYSMDFEGEAPMLYADYVEKAAPIPEVVTF